MSDDWSDDSFGEEVVYSDYSDAADDSFSAPAPSAPTTTTTTTSRSSSTTPPTRAPSAPASTGPRALTGQALVDARASVERQMSSTLNLSEPITSMLLRMTRWDAEKLMKHCFEDRAAFLTACGCSDTTGPTFQLLDESPLAAFYPPGANSSPSRVPFSTLSSARVPLVGAAISIPFTCPICSDEVTSSSSAFALATCGHPFCRPCWRDYLEDKIRQGTVAVTTHCPMYKCRVAVTDDVARELCLWPAPAAASTPDEARALPPLSAGKLVEMYSESVTRSFVEGSRYFKWCPAPGCEYAIHAPDLSTTSVECACGERFCFKCGSEFHEPCSCEMLAEWLEKCRNESETAHWIIVNTKKCPQCRVRIEKNQGCNHLRCRECAFEFCWVCEGPWAEHGNHTGGFYKCNKYDPKKKAKKKKAKKAKKGVRKGKSKSKSKRASKAAPSAPASPSASSDSSSDDDDTEEAQAELDRYLHYYQRYHNHDQSKRFAVDVLRQAEQRMRRMQNDSSAPSSSSSSLWVDVQFLKDAAKQVFACRQVLKYTYAFGYYLEPGPEKELFEFLQQELEKNTEHLSELSEMPIECLDRSEVVNYTRVTQRFLNNLLDGVRRGLTNA